MLIDSKIVNSKDIIKVINTKLKNMCKFAPVPVSFKLSDNNIEVSVYDDTKIFYFVKEPSIDVEKTIKTVKDWLITKYPKLKQLNVKYEDYSDDDLLKLVRQGKDVDDLVKLQRKITTENNYVILSYKRKDNTVVIKDLNNHKKMLYRKKSDSFGLVMELFLYKLYNSLTDIEAYQKFTDNFEFIKNI